MILTFTPSVKASEFFRILLRPVYMSFAEKTNTFLFTGIAHLIMSIKTFRQNIKKFAGIYWF